MAILWETGLVGVPCIQTCSVIPALRRMQHALPPGDKRSAEPGLGALQ